MPGCETSNLSGDEADLNETGTSCVTRACDNILKSYGVLFLVSDRETTRFRMKTAVAKASAQSFLLSEDVRNIDRTQSRRALFMGSATPFC